MDPQTLAPYLDFANHKPDAVEADIRFICDKVREHGFNAAFMNPYWVSIVREQFGFTGKIGTIVSFPLGQESLEIKITSSLKYAAAGANELDTVANISLIKQGKWDQVLHELSTLVAEVKAIHPQVIIKVIPECGYLNPDEIKKVAELMVQAKVDFFKTCSGLGPRGANLDDVKYVKEAVGDAIKIKVAGGVDTLDEATAYIDAGVTRMGTSHALTIIGAHPPQPSSGGE